MAEEKEIDCEYTDDLVCPYCGCKHGDDGEMNEDGAFQCYACKKHFKFEVIYTKDFKSWKVDCLNGQPHEWRSISDLYPRYPNARRCVSCYETQWKPIEQKRGGE